MSALIGQHSVLHHMFADDTELYSSRPPNDIHSLICAMQLCTTDVKKWTVFNKLQLNQEKTEVLLISSPRLDVSAFPDSVTIVDHVIRYSDSARNLGVMFDCNLSMNDHVNKVCQTCYFEIKNIAAIRHVLTFDATKRLITSFVLSRLDYCNSLLFGAHQDLIDKLQKVMNAAARMICRSSRREHITPLLVELHWLPVSSRIEYKIATMCYKVIVGTAPIYLADVLQVYTPSRSLRSAFDNRTFVKPKMRLKTQGERSFAFAGPVVWNRLPHDIRHAPSLSVFKARLKTHLFSLAY